MDFNKQELALTDEKYSPGRKVYF